MVAAGGVRSRGGVRVRRDVLHPGEIVDLDGVRVTSRLRTAFDLARSLPLTDGVVAVDALVRGEFPPGLLLDFTVRYPGLRGMRTVLDVLCLADARSGSPPETRLRAVLTAWSSVAVAAAEMRTTAPRRSTSRPGAHLGVCCADARDGD